MLNAHLISSTFRPRGRHAAGDALDCFEEVNSMQTFSQMLYARLVTAFSREDGQTMAEYGVILAVITVVIVGTLVTLSGSINTKLGDVIDALTP
jgi:Flp pilus assembly pilin Flp